MRNRKQVVIVGGGFAGVAAARNLDTDKFDVTLLDSNNYHLFQPLLYQVATGSLSAADVTTPLRMILRSSRTRVLQESVTGIDPQTKTLATASGHHYQWDILILAIGLGHSYFGRDEWAAHAPSLKYLNDALHIRSRILGSLEEAETCEDPVRRDQLLRFIVVGGGPTGVELAGAIGELTSRSLAREFRLIDPTKAEILLVESDERILRQYSQSSSARAESQLAALGVRVLVARKVTAVDDEGVTLSSADGNDERFDSANVIWAAGAAATSAGRKICEALALDPAAGGRISVGEHFEVPEHPGVFVVGDLAAYRSGDGFLPGIAPAAEQSGRYVGRYLSGHSDHFEYRERGHLAVIGRNAAVGKVLGREVSGPVAWWMWLFVHIFGLIGIDVKLRVLVVWAWKFFFHKYGARIISADD